jgi:beta-aspartyl-peptidase (threonine type)
MSQQNIALAIHGGAGTILRSLMTPELESEYRGGLENALQKGWEVLKHGGSALDCVEETVCILEDFSLFNAGRGAVFTHEGKNEMDASIMDGRKLSAGAVAAVKNVKNPIKLARLVMEKTEHVFLAGAGANQFALEMGVDMADDAYFYTEHRYQQLLRAREAGIVQVDHTADEQKILEDKARTDVSKGNRGSGQVKKPGVRSKKPIGTVGAVACDSNGNLAAATSTGGMTNKKFGRVGDTPLVGAGTYADNATCAVSGTGHGEFFMRGVTAYDVAARMKYQGVDLFKAARRTIEHLTDAGGEGGIIAVDSHGNITMPFNSDGMYRGCISSDSELTIKIYGD